MQYGSLPLLVKTDCEELVKAYRRGRKYCCDRRRPAADLWRMVFLWLDEMGATPEEGLTLQWVKGHATPAMVASGEVQWADKELNDFTDELAKKGAKLAEELVPAQPWLEAYKRGRSFYFALVPFCVNWVEDTVADIELPKRVRKPGVSVHAESPHDLWVLTDGTIRCVACRRGGKYSGARMRNFCRSRCRGFGATGPVAEQLRTQQAADLKGRGGSQGNHPPTSAAST